MKQRYDKKDYICWTILGISFIALIIRGFLGFDWSDEPFYLSTANRFYLGDRIVVDEWNPAQIASLILLPVLTIFRNMTGGTEGIILFSRMLYCVILMITSIYFYNVMSRMKGNLIAILATVLYLFYARMGIPTCSYNTISASCVLVCLTILYDSAYRKEVKALSFIVGGCLYSIIVLSIPYFAVGYVGVLLICFFTLWKYKNSPYRELIKRGLAYSFLGIVLSASIFLIYVFSKVSLRELIEFYPNLFNEPEYLRNVTVTRRILRMFNAVVKQYVWTIFIYLISIAYLGYKKYKGMPLSDKAMIWNWTIQLILLFVNVCLSGFGKRSGISFIPFSMFGLFFLLVQKTYQRKDLLCWYLPGLCMAPLFFFSSDTGIFAIGAGCLYSGIATIILCVEYIQSIKRPEHIWKVLSIATFAGVLFVIGTTAYLRMTYVYRDHEISVLNVRITEGAAKGLYTSAENAKKQQEVKAALQKHVTDEDKLFITKLLPWGYLETDATCAASSTWRTYLSTERILQYYEIKPERIPDVVYVVAEGYGYHNDENELSGKMKEMLESSDYKKVEEPCGVFYKRVTK